MRSLVGSTPTLFHQSPIHPRFTGTAAARRDVRPLAHGRTIANERMEKAAIAA